MNVNLFRGKTSKPSSKTTKRISSSDTSAPTIAFQIENVARKLDAPPTSKSINSVIVPE
jgi:hypothetical protein